MKKIFLILFLLLISCAPTIATAQVQLETGLPNIPGNRLEAGQELPSYINYLFIFGLGAITILALAQMMSGGIQYILAAGNVAKHEEAINTIQQALLGLGLLLASYLLLRTINPDLVNLKNPNLTPTQFQGETCAEWNAEGLQSCMDQGGMTWEECKKAACIKETTTNVSDWLKNQNDTDTALKTLSTMANGSKINIPMGYAERINDALLICNPDCTLDTLRK